MLPFSFVTFWCASSQGGCFHVPKVEASDGTSHFSLPFYFTATPSTGGNLSQTKNEARPAHVPLQQCSPGVVASGILGDCCQGVPPWDAGGLGICPHWRWSPHFSCVLLFTRAPVCVFFGGAAKSCLFLSFFNLFFFLLLCNILMCIITRMYMYIEASEVPLFSYPAGGSCWVATSTLLSLGSCQALF